MLNVYINVSVLLSIWIITIVKQWYERRQAVLAIPQDPIQNNNTDFRCSNRRTFYPYWELVS
jgi:hypothetical protein